MTTAERFLARFSGLERAHGVYEPSGKTDGRGKVSGRARTVKEPVTVRLWEAHLAGVRGIGVVPIRDDGTCVFGAIDVDRYDVNHAALERRIEEAGLPLTVCRTKSGGAHLYLFLREPAPAGLVRDRLAAWALALGHPKAEIFPKQSELRSDDDVGSWLNMPYFGGDDTTRYAVVGGEAIRTDDFLDRAEATAVTVEGLVSIEVRSDPTFEDGPPCLQFLTTEGFPEGTRNSGLYNLGVFCKMKFGDEWQERLREMNRRYLRPPLSDAEVTGVVRSLERKSYFYQCKEQPIASACNRAICSRREHGIGRSSGDPGVSLDNLQKVLSDPPFYYVNVDGRRVRLDSTADLMMQSRFDLIAVEQANVVPKRVKENVWRERIRELLSRVEEVEAPEDASVAGQFWLAVEEFCVQREGAATIDEVGLGRAFTDEKERRTYFLSHHLIQYAENRRVRIAPPRAWAVLREHGGQATRRRIKGVPARIWSVPAFERRDHDFGARVVRDDGEGPF